MSVPRTQNQGEIIPHILLMKAPAIVFYPSLVEYLNYCAGFTLLDLPWLNGVFAETFTDSSETAPPGFLTFYTNINLASTYLLAFCVFSLLSFVLLILKIRYEQKKIYEPQEYEPTINRIEQLKKYVCHIFMSGLVFAGFGCILGILYNPHN